MASEPLYRPPAPVPKSPLRSLLRMLREGDGNLLSLVPADAYRKRITPLGYSRRSIILVNDPAAIREVMTDPLAIFPKNDLFVGALGPLVGDSIFVSEGATWQRQRDMIDPAFSHMRIDQSFAAMSEAVDACETTLAAAAINRTAVSLDLTMSQLTADVICRTIFSQPLLPERASAVFDAFSEFERSVASVSAVPLLAGKPWATVDQPQRMLDACARIRSYIGELVDPRLAADSQDHASKDILAAVMTARDAQSGQAFSRSELIDQIGVFFLAGHETTASALTWAFYILAQQPNTLARLRAEVDALAGTGPITLEHIKQLRFTRSIFREVLRLYPPITFIPRVAAESTTIAGVRIKRGAMVMISPWATHRNALLWRDADRFDPQRFDTEKQSGDSEATGPFLTFGMGPRVCVGIAFATMESSLILARLCRSFDIVPQDPATVRPIARLTTRPAHPIQVRIQARRPS
ncbi:MAG: cytochrome P450 [Pseudomonadales bacterium]